MHFLSIFITFSTFMAFFTTTHFSTPSISLIFIKNHRSNTLPNITRFDLLMTHFWPTFWTYFTSFLGSISDLKTLHWEKLKISSFKYCKTPLILDLIFGPILWPYFRTLFLDTFWIHHTHFSHISGHQNTAMHV